MALRTFCVSDLYVSTALAVDGDIELTGDSASKFESDAGTSSHGTWNNCEKALLLTVASDLGFCAEVELEFCFQVANPIEPQVYPTHPSPAPSRPCIHSCFVL